MSHLTSVSVVVIAKDEAHIIQSCLDSLSWADEVVVVDDYSSDHTPSIAERAGARVITHRFDTFAGQRNWALKHARLRNEWVLMLDADEACTPAFTEAIENALNSVNDDTAAFKMCRKTMLSGRWLRYSDGYPVWIMRLVRNGRARFEDSGHGEVPVPSVDGRVQTIVEPFVHQPFSRGIQHWWDRHIRYAQREAWQECQEAANLDFRALVARDPSQRRAALRAFSRRLPCRAAFRFCYQYLFKRGFLDGAAGLQFCRMMACYEQMIVTKKWELAQSMLAESCVDRHKALLPTNPPTNQAVDEPRVHAV
ncbi:glycosyltransferase family 2 protein [Rhodopirellula sp. MGV]|uniref:glycosyltransferase family 2 protein n=1 Tax=Rhodopirellula sp. MGV TaxID=2023130 RepID=UPI000B968820|nr:glycosyltransferase family 2 protein [Rhodopirellula sp. MGV]OYP39149.1 hypothetical protein CGZ80_00430 [Rhodopirellula sp. MGV]PNY35474.1 glycosyltransferase family 2 protein [Rhodopirellula baltica]